MHLFDVIVIRCLDLCHDVFHAHRVRMRSAGRGSAFASPRQIEVKRGIGLLGGAAHLRQQTVQIRIELRFFAGELQKLVQQVVQLPQNLTEPAFVLRSPLADLLTQGFKAGKALLEFGAQGGERLLFQFAAARLNFAIELFCESRRIPFAVRHDKQIRRFQHQTRDQRDGIERRGAKRDYRRDSNGVMALFVDV